MTQPKTLSLRILSKEKWELIEHAVETNNELMLKRLIEPEKELSKEEEIIQTKAVLDLSARQVDMSEVMYFIYNGISYDKPKEEVMDALSKYAEKHNIPVNSLRFAVENIDDDYTVKYQMQYSEDVRQFVNEGDLSAMLDSEDRSLYYREELLREEREKEQKEYEENTPYHQMAEILSGHDIEM